MRSRRVDECESFLPCCDDLHLGKCRRGICDIRRITCGIEQVNGIFLAKRIGWIVRMGMVAVMQSVSSGICWPVALVEKLKAD